MKNSDDTIILTAYLTFVLMVALMGVLDYNLKHDKLERKPAIIGPIEYVTE